MEKNKKIIIAIIIIALGLLLIILNTGGSESKVTTRDSESSARNGSESKVTTRDSNDTENDSRDGSESKVTSRDGNNNDRSGSDKGEGKANGSSEFIIETKSIGDFNVNSYIEKVGKISSNETINVSSQVSGKLDYIYVKEGQEVFKGDTIAILEDSYNKYYLDLDKAEIDYEKAFIVKESTILSLDKKISDSKISSEIALYNYENAKITVQDELKEAKLNYENSNLDDITSESSLELEKIKLDYQNTVNSNIQKINTYISNASKENNNLYLSLTDVIKFSDELLGVTIENKNSNNSFKDYLGVKSKESIVDANAELLDLINFKEEINNLNSIELKEENLVEVIDSFYSGYQKINTLLLSIEVVLNNSISSIGSLSDSDINSYISQVNSYQNSNQGNLSSFNSTRSNIVSFINTYKNGELYDLKTIELKEKLLKDSSSIGETSYNKIITSIKGDLYSSKSKYTQAKAEYDNAVANKVVSIKSLDNSIASAKNSRDKYSLEYSKLTIKSPITGIVSTINIDNNSDVSNGTKLFTIIGNSETQIEVSLTSSEIGNVIISEKVTVEYLGKNYIGEVYSKSSVADNKLEYKVIISLFENIDLIGGSTLVKFSSKNNSILLPLEIINIQGNNIGTINYFAEGILKTLDVTLGNIVGNSVEIISELPDSIEIISTNLSNYNSLNQTLKINNNK